MAAEDSKITKPDLKEIVASVVAVIAALALTLSNDLLRGDQAMALAAVVPTLAWIVFTTYASRRMFRPKRSQSEQAVAAEDAPEDSAEGDPDGDRELSHRWGPHRRWLIGIVVPIVIVIMLLIGYDVDEVTGPDLRVPAPIALIAVMVFMPWIVGLLAYAFLVMPGGLIIRGLRQDPGHRAGPIFGGAWVYIVTAFALTATQTGLTVNPATSSGMADGIADLFGFGEETVRETGWLWAARILFVTGIAVMPVIGTILASRSKKNRKPHDETAPLTED